MAIANALNTYHDKCQALVTAYQQQKRAKQAIQLKKNVSNLFRARHAHTQKLDVRSFNQVLFIDPDKQTVKAEGMITFEYLVDETLKQGFLPAIVPELKTITLGGAVAGIGIESSSFKYGLVHEAVTELDILTGNGDIVTANAHNEHRDLFLGFPNSYGTLGYTLSVTIKIVPAKPYIKLTHQCFSDTETYYHHLGQACRHTASTVPDFIEGAIFNDQEKILTTATQVDHAPRVSHYTYAKIYHRSLRKKHTDFLTTKDYIWRWDTDWFWCSKTFGMENRLLRLLFGKMLLQSKKYWAIKNWFDHHPRIMRLYNLVTKDCEPVIQDVVIPFEHAAKFYQFFRDDIGITPVWNCPVTATDTPFSLFPLQANQLYVNFGFWSSVPSQHPPGHYNRLIEQTVTQLNGRKSLYSSVHYSEDEFWALHDKPAYLALKQRYDTEHALRELFEKCTEK